MCRYDKRRTTEHGIRNELNDKPALKRKLFTDDILKNDEPVKFYMGFPTLACLMAIFNLLKPAAEKLKYWDSNKGKKVNFQYRPVKKSGKRRSLIILQEFILTLVRLRLGLLVQHLLDTPSISKSSVCMVLTTWIFFLTVTLRDVLLTWPSKEMVRLNFPGSFRNYPSTRVIIDCTEIFIQKPTSPAAQRATWSEYKSHNAIKTLVGITPSGFFSFVSKLWSGSTSDRKLTQKSGILELIGEGDHVMADRGFAIRDLLTKRKAFLNMPPFSKKGQQLSKKSLKTTRSIASARIHVDRAIERLKDFHILPGNLPIPLVPLADKILIVCAALCSLLPPLAK
ncbi:uncharacterized protein LOC111334310 [Stylophora pistillata]|uniref:DDE Tnp4 domain-containing protein n=1 Tax=Stylophora pistillata TaxID=50429 RepID=A0A2B4S1P4_STYPI|nr:uncharacterized protein LOC111334310 [Stylophora pistillata]PFX22405.1 hypothetical protein AWC38_SpisGene13083 [Stylophora pistillata]